MGQIIAQPSTLQQTSSILLGPTGPSGSCTNWAQVNKVQRLILNNAGLFLWHLWFDFGNYVFFMSVNLHLKSLKEKENVEIKCVFKMFSLCFSCCVSETS